MIKFFPAAKLLNHEYLTIVLDEITDDLLIKYDAFVISPVEFERLLTQSFNEKLVILLLNDYINTTHVRSNNILECNELNILRKIADQNVDKIFVCISGVSHYANNSFSVGWPIRSNLHFVEFGIVYELNNCKKIDPVTIKNMDSTRIGVSLSRQMRQHRMAFSSLLYGLNLNEFCYISAMHLKKQLIKLPSTSFMDHCDWQFQSEQYYLRDIMILGFQKLCAQQHNQEIIGPSEDIYSLQANSTLIAKYTNVDNFQNNLRSIYKNSFVEFVNCTLFADPLITFNEKFINSVFGFNFPIIIGSVGTVQYYKELGFDMFDDIVDHSYDLIIDPIDRVNTAVVSNQHLLADYDSTKHLWATCHDRFFHNFNFVQNQLHDKIITLAKQKFTQIVIND